MSTRNLIGGAKADGNGNLHMDIISISIFMDANLDAANKHTVV